MATKTQQQVVIRLGQDWRNLKAGRVVRLVGTPPPDLRTFETWTGTVADDVPEINHTKDLELAAHLRELQSRPPTAPVKVTAADVCTRFQWTPPQLESAGSLGFPPPAGMTQRAGLLGIGRGALAPFWWEQDVDGWAARLAGLGFVRGKT
jgi:hypothetical protein